MRCRRCGETIVLAVKCPFCGFENPPRNEGEDAAAGRGGNEDSSRGRFRGSMGGDASTVNSGGKEVSPSLANVLRFITDPDISMGSKLVVFAILFYVLSPIDLLPGFVFPIVGWLDDIALMVLGWRWIANHLRGK